MPPPPPVTPCPHPRVRLGPSQEVERDGRVMLYQWGYCADCGALLERLTQLRTPGQWRRYRGMPPQPTVDRSGTDG